MFENIILSVENLENNLTFKNDYTDELSKLDTLESDAKTLRYQGVENWKINELLRVIERIRDWIYQELDYRDKYEVNE